MPGHVAQARRHRRNSLILPSASVRDELSVLYGLCGENAGGSALTPRPSRSDKSGTRCNADRIFAALKVVPSRRAKGAVKRFVEMGLCAPCRGAPAVVLRFSCQRSSVALFASACHFQSAKHTFKASVACNGREVLRGTPGRRHGISAIEAADRASDHEPTIHWQVSRTSAACREGSRKHLSPSAMRSEPVGRIGGTAVISRRRQSHAPS